jgi:hypothetical protein
MSPFSYLNHDYSQTVQAAQRRLPHGPRSRISFGISRYDHRPCTTCHAIRQRGEQHAVDHYRLGALRGTLRPSAPISSIGLGLASNMSAVSFGSFSEPQPEPPYPDLSAVTSAPVESDSPPPPPRANQTSPPLNYEGRIRSGCGLRLEHPRVPG